MIYRSDKASPSELAENKAILEELTNPGLATENLWSLATWLENYSQMYSYPQKDPNAVLSAAKVSMFLRLSALWMEFW